MISLILIFGHISNNFLILLLGSQFPHVCDQIMQVSTITLAFMRADFLTPTMQFASQLTFALSFFACRIILSPIIYYQNVTTMYRELILEPIEYDKHNENCYPIYIYYITILFGAFFHCLNLFWFVKLVQKARRKLSGEESLEVDELWGRKNGYD